MGILEKEGVHWEKLLGVSSEVLGWWKGEELANGCVDGS